MLAAVSAKNSPSMPRLFFSFSATSKVLYVFGGDADTQAAKSTISLSPASPLSDLYKVFRLNFEYQSIPCLH